MLTLFKADDGHSVAFFCPIWNFICQLREQKKCSLWLLSKIFLTIFKSLLGFFEPSMDRTAQNNSVHFLSKLLVFQRARGFRSSALQVVDHIFYEMLIFLWKKAKCCKVFLSRNTQRYLWGATTFLLHFKLNLKCGLFSFFTIIRRFRNYPDSQIVLLLGLC